MNKALSNAFGIALVALGMTAQAGTVYPNRPITLIVPFSTGSGSDTTARILSEHLSKELGVAVVVENKPGANGSIGSQFVARAKPDGYTFLLGSATTNAVNLSLYPKTLGYNEASFVMVSTLGRGIIGLFFPSKSPWKNLAEYLKEVKNGTVQNASCGSGNSVTLIACEMFKKTAGIDAVTVPYKSNGQALNDVAGGQLGFAFSDLNAALPFKDGTRLRTAAVTAENRYTTLPNVPTLAEQGVPGMFFSSWTGVFAPKGTADPILNKVNIAINNWLDSPSAAEQFKKTGTISEKTNLVESAAFYRAEASRWKEYIEKANVKIN
ncbi:hypothetical protein CAP48_12390 [Advenella sp. S44]|uniref:Bug family tripartite tricarboxylate transporter substrate binding protein n=1 Tax=Advenella sp. S44 TaxID=1982755 RepID=UPI000C2B41AC|nr:tripartite tricarboxylate transporter substrate binding protein [Advenella sp. S44]PJX23867.1 hypothetical protein CAP48_12390 [Advenella sp. S44]